MKKQLMTVRDVEERVVRKFKARAAEEGLKMGDALSQAMEAWIMEKANLRHKPNPKNFMRLKGFVKTTRKVRWSEEIDEILYGGKK